MNMPESRAFRSQELHDAVVRKAAETMFRKYKVVMNVAGNNVASIEGLYPDLLVYEVFSVKPFLSSDKPLMIGVVATDDEIDQALIAEWAQLEDLDVEKVILILPEEVRNQAETMLKDLAPKFELHYFDEDLHINSQPA